MLGYALLQVVRRRWHQEFAQRLGAALGEYLHCEPVGHALGAEGGDGTGV